MCIGRDFHRPFAPRRSKPLGRQHLSSVWTPPFRQNNVDGFTSTNQCQLRRHELVCDCHTAVGPRWIGEFHSQLSCLSGWPMPCHQCGADWLRPSTRSFATGNTQYRSCAGQREHCFDRPDRQVGMGLASDRVGFVVVAGAWFSSHRFSSHIGQTRIERRSQRAGIPELGSACELLLLATFVTALR